MIALLYIKRVNIHGRAVESFQFFSERLPMRKLCRTLTVLLLIMNFHRMLSAQVIGSVDFGGNRTLDIDSLANASAQHWQWLSFPGARFALNPSKDAHDAPGEPEHDMPLNLGGWIGTSAIKMLGLNRIQIGPDQQSVAAANTLVSTWYPYKYTYVATYANGTSIQTDDFFIDSDATLVRRIKINAKSKAVLELTGNFASGNATLWSNHNSILRVVDDGSNYALAFSRVANGRTRPIRKPASTTIGKYLIYLQVPRGESEYAVCFGESVKPESDEIAIARATKACGQAPEVLLQRTKSIMEDALRRVPAPGRWGIHSDENHDVSEEEHRRAYYAAWTFLLEDVVKILPESSYKYEQVLCGKPSLWRGGAPQTPGVAQWDSLFGIQWLAYINPSEAWSAFRGIMSLVNDQGVLAGESLPARKAQTAWILYSITKDQASLKEVYPAIRRNLLWEEAHPRWMYPGHNPVNERSLEFTSSWIYDTGFAARICATLSGCEDGFMWRQEQEKMVKASQEWFFSDPSAIRYSYLANNSKPGQLAEPARDAMWDAYIAQALGIPQFPQDTKQRLLDYFESRFHPHEFGMGTDSYKYPDVNLIAYGLLDAHSASAWPFIEGVLAESIRAGNFGERITRAPAAGGVQESLFSAMNVIEFTWLMNKCRYDGGPAVAMRDSAD
jgi:hypothetical protein